METKEERIQRLVKEGIEREKQTKATVPVKAVPKAAATVPAKIVSAIIVIMFAIVAGQVMFKTADPVGYNNFLLYTVYGYDKPITNEYMPVAAPALNPARDLTGSWSGTFRHTENKDISCCTTRGKVTMTLQQTGNKVTGTYSFPEMITTSPDVKEFNNRGASPTIPIIGTVGGTRFEFTDTNIQSAASIRYSASFTSDMLKVNYESCSLNELCLSGEEERMVIDGISAENTGSYGIKGVMTLTRDR